MLNFKNNLLHYACILITSIAFLNAHATNNIKPYNTCPMLAGPNQAIKASHLEHRMRCGTDWEPTLAADPNFHAPYVYMMTTTFDKNLCTDVNNEICAANALVLRVSHDRGKSFSDETIPCDAQCVNELLRTHPETNRYLHSSIPREKTKSNKSLFEYDPSLFVCKDGHGTVLLTYLIGFIPGVVVQTSKDHGKTWLPAVPVGLTEHLLKTGGTDKSTITASDDCSHIYVAFDGDDGNYVVTSQDGGKSFSQPVRTSPDVLPGNEYHDWFSPNGTTNHAGNVYFSQTLNNENNSDDPTLAIVSSINNGATWKTDYLGKLFYAHQCDPASECSIGYLTPQIVIGSAGQDQTAIAFTRAANRYGSKKLYFLANWKSVSHPLDHAVLVNDKGDSNFPMITGGKNACDYTVTWMDNRYSTMTTSSRTSPGPFNIYLKRTQNCGLTWSKEIVLSNVYSPNIAKYKNNIGFTVPFGDYTGLAMNSFGDIFAIWGEGQSINDEGSAWFRVIRKN